MVAKTFKPTGLALFTALLISCGGGGGDGGSPGGGNNIIPPGPGPILEDLDCDAEGTSVGSSVDTDGDGLNDCDELTEFGTNPQLRDTDGDSFGDMAEATLFDPLNNRTQFNPLVSDLPRFAVDLTSVPQIELTFTDSNQTTQTVATSHDQGTSAGVSRSRGGESSRQLEVGHTLSVSTTNTVGVEVTASPTDFGASASFESSLTLGLSSTTTQTVGSSVNWTSEQRRENTETFGQSEELSRTNGTVFTGGTLRVTVQVRNSGAIAYDMENLTLSAFIFDPARPFDMESVGNLTFLDEQAFPTTTVTTNSVTAPLNFSLNLTLPQARRLLRDSENLVIVPATFRLLDSDSRSILLRDQDVSAQTATVQIDFGPQSNRLSTHRVAVNRGGASRSIDALSALRNLLGFDIVEGPGSWIYGNQGSPTNTPTGITSIDGFAMSSSSNSYWYGALNRSGMSNSGARTTDILNLLQEGYQLGDLELRAGDTLSFVYVSDSDRDALPDRYELEFGTNPDLADTDGDTLLDATEIYGTNLSEAPCTLPGRVIATSNPLLMDSDGDGTNDATEIANCENPNFLVIADAGTDQVVNVDTTVRLSGNAEGFFSGQPEFTWRLNNGPDIFVNGAAVRTLEGISPTFSAPESVSTLVFTLEVLVDGSTSTDQVVVQVQRDRSAAVYVGANNGSGNGTVNSPFGTLEEAIAFISPGEDLYVQSQMRDGDVVPYALVNSLDIPDGTSLYGGYDENWIRNVEAFRTPVVLSASVDLQSVFNFPVLTLSAEVSGFLLQSDTGSTNTSHNMVALSASGAGQGRLLVENNTLMAGNVADGTSTVPGSSYGALFQDLAQLQLRNNQILAGNGGMGADGVNGASGVSGNDGRNASGRTRGARGSGQPGANGGNGGAGGGAPFGGGSAGSRGDGSQGRSGGSGGGAGGGTGRPGATGGPGAAGAAAGYFASTLPLFDAAGGGNGVEGTNGTGGGGGGGGAGRDIAAGGGGGGGGGEGGTFGRLGTGASGGGASVGVWLFGVSVAEVRGNLITASSGGNAGNGGRGGNGGSGGSAGSGAAGNRNIVGVRGQRGGNGGRGGSGGRGGDGAGGSGGPSIALFVGPSVAPIVVENSFTTAQAGRGGAMGNTGHGGESVGIFDGDANDGRQPNARDNRFMIGQGGAAGSTPSSSGVQGLPGCSGETNCR